MAKVRIDIPAEAISVHAFTKGMIFPVFVYACNEWEETQIGYLTSHDHTTKSLITWCMTHKIGYRLVQMKQKGIKNKLIYKLAYHQLMKSIDEDVNREY